MKAASLAKTYGFFRFILNDVDESNTWEDTWGGYLTQFNVQLQGSGASDVAIGFRGNEVVLSTVY